jgi:hypothetical protein
MMNKEMTMKPTKSYEAAIWRVALTEASFVWDGTYGRDADGRDWISWVYGVPAKTVAKDIKALGPAADAIVEFGKAKAKKMGYEAVVV